MLIFKNRKLGMWLVTQAKTDPATIPIGIFNFVESENFILKTLGIVLFFGCILMN